MLPQYSLAQIAQILNVPLNNGDDDSIMITGFSSDTRTIQPGNLFIALSGPNFNGNLFAEKAIELGACGALLSEPVSLNAPSLIVKDTLAAYGQIATHHKANTSAKTIAITGSVGKTSVKEMCAAILGLNNSVHATKGNLNNEIGAPRTLLELTPQHEFAVIELGANHQGEIARTVAMTQPDVALINNVAPSHLEGFGSIDGVFQAKSEIYSGLNDNGIAIVNGDSPYLANWQQLLAEKIADNKVIFFSTEEASLNKPNFMVATDISKDESGHPVFTINFNGQQQSVTLNVPGRHQVNNALAAASCCLALGINLKQVSQGLAQFKPVKGRVNVYQLNSGASVIDDSYNANVESVKAAIDLLADNQGYKLLVLGDMGELGSQSQFYHHQVGEYAQQKGINQLMTLGQLSKAICEGFAGNGEHFTELGSMMTAINKVLEAQTNVQILVKGSRSAKMERVVEQLINNKNKD